MFLWLKKSLFHKATLILAFSLIIAIIVGIFFSRILGALFALAALLFYSFFLYSVHRPLTRVIREMKFLLANKKYSRIFSTRVDEWGVIAHFFNEVTKNIEKISVTLNEGARMSSELNIAADIQKMVLPEKIPEVPGLDIFVNTRPEVEIGGDNYDVIRSKDNAFIYVGDVTGHGVPAGLVMMMANTLLHTFAESHENSYDIVTQTNRMIKPRMPHTMFMTMVMLRWSDSQKKMYFTGAGHEYIIIYHEKTNELEVKQSGGIAIGMLPDISKILKEEALNFEAEDFLILYSDGITEARNSAGEEFGLKRFQDSIHKYAGESRNSNELFTKISTDFGAFTGNTPQTDDITLMVIRRVP